MTAEKKPEAEVAAARKSVEKKLETMRAVVERLVADTAAHDRAARELMVSQNKTQQGREPISGLPNMRSWN